MIARVREHLRHGAFFSVQKRWRQAFAVMLVFFRLCAAVQNSERHETLHGAEAQVQHRLVPAHGLSKELHGLLFEAVLKGCWVDMSAAATPL